MDYPVLKVEGVQETDNFAQTGLPRGVRRVTFATDPNPVAKKGLFVLIQLTILVLLRSPGRDVFSPGTGGGLKLLLARNAGPQLLTQRKGEIAVSVARTVDQIVSEQAGADLPPEERLQSLTMLNAEYDAEAQTWNIILRLVSDAGGAADVLV